MIDAKREWKAAEMTAHGVPRGGTEQSKTDGQESMTDGHGGVETGLRQRQLLLRPAVQKARAANYRGHTCCGHTDVGTLQTNPPRNTKPQVNGTHLSIRASPPPTHAAGPCVVMRSHTCGCVGDMNQSRV